MKKFFRNMEVKLMTAVQSLVKNEDGDTNFISILIIMGVVILLAGVFMGFKDQIVGMVQDIIDGFTIS